MGMEGYSGGMGMTPAEAVLISDRDRRCDNCNDGFGWGGGMVGVLFLFFIMAMLGGGSWGGFGGWGRGAWGNMATAEGQYATQADIQRGFDHNTVVNKLDGITQGICQLGYNDAQLQNQTQAAIAQLGFQQLQCCCDTNRNIDAVRYENAKNTCDIIQAGNANTQRIIDHLTQDTIQNLRDQVQTANFQLSQQAQTANLVDQLRPCARPAYITCSPYTSFGYPYGYANAGCGGCCGNTFA